MRSFPSFLTLLCGLGLVLLAVGVCLGISACIVIPLMLTLFTLDDAVGEIGGHDTTSLRWKTTMTVAVSVIALLLAIFLGQLWMPLLALVLAAIAFALWVIWT